MSVTSVRRIARSALSGMTIVALLVFGIPATAGAASTDTGRIAGVLTDVDGDPIRSALISAQSTAEGSTPRSVYVDIEGRFALSLPAGDYIVSADLHSNSQPDRHSLRWWPGVDSAEAATPVSVVAGEDVDASWQLGSIGPGITGVVTDAVSHAPLSWAAVSITGPGGAIMVPTHTNRDGRYRFPALPPGTYTLTASIYAGSPQDETHVAASSTIEVSAGFTQWSPALVPTGGVTLRTDRGFLDTGTMDLYRVGSDRAVFTHLGRDGGSIVATGLAPGRYEFFIARAGRDDFVDTWWPDAATRGEAGSITVEPGRMTTVDWALPRGATVSGRATSSTTGERLAELDITAYDGDGRWTTSAKTDSTGAFRLLGLRTGDYVLRATGNGFTSADVSVHVEVGQDANRDIVVAPQGTVTVQTVFPANAMKEKRLSLYTAEHTLVSAQWAQPGAGLLEASTSFYRLDAGDYYLYAGEGDGTLSGWYGGQALRTTAQRITVRAGETTTVPFTLVATTAQNSGSLSVRARGPEQEFADGLTVELYDGDGALRASQTTTRGATVFTELPLGDYRVRFVEKQVASRHPFTTIWWGGSSLDSASPVSVAAGETAVVEAVIPRTLPADSVTLTGTVPSPVPSLLAGSIVRAWRVDRSVGSIDAVVDATGRFTIPGLYPGQYVVQFVDSPRWAYGLRSAYAPSADTRAEATVYAAAAGDTVVADFTSITRTGDPSASVVRGVVVSAVTGRPLSGAEVTLNGSGQRVSSTSGADGSFEIALVGADGDHVLSIPARNGLAATSRHVSLSTGTATAVTLTAPGALTTTAPVLPSTVRVGVKSVASAKGWSAGTALTYQWKRDGAAIKGATAVGYTPKAADRGHKLTVTVTGTKQGYATASRTSAAKTVAYGTIASATPKITGTRKVGRKLTAVAGSWTAGVTLSYQWYANGTRIAGATARTYTLTWREARDRITVKVTARKSGYTSISRTSAATARISR